MATQSLVANQIITIMEKQPKEQNLGKLFHINKRTKALSVAQENVKQENQLQSCSTNNMITSLVR